MAKPSKWQNWRSWSLCQKLKSLFFKTGVCLNESPDWQLKWGVSCAVHCWGLELLSRWLTFLLTAHMSTPLECRNWIIGRLPPIAARWRHLHPSPDSNSRSEPVARSLTAPSWLLAIALCIGSSLFWKSSVWIVISLMIRMTPSCLLRQTSSAINIWSKYFNEGVIGNVDGARARTII